VLQARLAGVEQRLEAGTVSVVRGGKALLRKRGSLAEAGMTEAWWRREWQSARLFLTADGEKDKAWGNETIRWSPPDQAAQDRSGPPATQGHVPLAQQER
jgi:hypothetical protein